MLIECAYNQRLTKCLVILSYKMDLRPAQQTNHFSYPPGTRSGRPLLTQLAPYPVQSPQTVQTMQCSNFHLCIRGGHIKDLSSFSSSSSSRSSSMAVAMFSTPNPAVIEYIILRKKQRRSNIVFKDSTLEAMEIFMQSNIS